MSNPPSTSASGANTPTSRFTKPTETLEDVLKTQTVGLVNLSEFKKRRAELLEQKEREAAERGRIGTPQPDSTGLGASSTTTGKDGTSVPPPRKKRKANINKGKLSFTPGDEDGEATTPTKGSSTPGTPAATGTDSTANPTTTSSSTPAPSSRDTSTTPPPTVIKARPNPSLPHPPPKALTKSTLRREAQERELLRREFLALQERIKNEEILIPFVFYDGTNVVPRETGVKVKKGDHVWLFLERARRMSGRREWLRVSVDDLLLVRGEVIIPHHYDFYYFLVNRTEGPNGLLFNYPSPLDTNSPPPSTTNLPAQEKPIVIHGTEDPAMTKVVDRRWYERNKHIFPASVWTNFDPSKNYRGMVRRDRDNNAFFFG
ncbi:XAP5, circadian clock regulator-domain-containing protein [Kalaharituber pfeilii]|nr:XAP5, circadian clock regulator-domain-containing protein [Kalaharituber pfeilii]